MSRAVSRFADRLLSVVVPSSSASAAYAVDGTRVTRDSLADGTLVGFFNHGCEPCAQMLPEFVVTAAGPTLTDLRRRVLYRGGVAGREPVRA